MTMKALIIDDKPLNIEVLEQLLKREGFQTFSSHTPNDILALLEEMGQVDIFFLDIEFPNHDALDFLCDLKEDPRLSGVPIVAYTVHNSLVNEARDAGFDSFIGKPINVMRFSEYLNDIIRGDSVWAIT